MNIKQNIQQLIQEIILTQYQIPEVILEIQDNKTEFEGDFTIVTFPLVKLLKKNPELIGQELGAALTTHGNFVQSYNVVKGFLNIIINSQFFVDNLKHSEEQLNKIEDKKESVMVEYCSPNTNKPLHLGHVRNNLLGFSIAKILKEAGYDVVKTQIINDRGIHICKSMVAWQKFGNGETPQSTGEKGDHLVGKYYVKFDQEYKKEIADLIANGKDEETAKKEAPIFLEAQKMLLDWEKGDAEVRLLWETMNSWVYAGFQETFDTMGVDFDEVLYESDTYILGKDIIQKGLADKILYRKEDGSIWCDLTEEGLDQKLLLRSDGTSVYMTQDLGTAVERFNSKIYKKLIYTVGNEQEYHFQVLFLILKKLGYSWAENLFHLSYGMVELPEGKMKSREGTVVDADDLMQEMVQTAKEKAEELGKLDTLEIADKEKSYERVGLGALKYFILKIDPKKKILFNPAESVDFNGNTGPFVQYTFARIQSLLKKSDREITAFPENYQLNIFEKNLAILLSNYKEVLEKAAENLSPALVANYIYEVVKTYNAFYQNNPILNQEDENIINFRLHISKLTAETIKKCLDLLGIQTVDRM
ncbi:arginine--tRNA ligase [Frigoriflavimonas asaccharolytica]|uniref:Arginine--tRNA ligase n=1 Tax=Frigoriflavimonas asaccharolytica TaxID=2735899 RepID=A0A8J8GD08_9FLAO|nr:arginine--tRNA ligase [Frigoriflavimonas asaccharolytica]NRS93700.1 arginyl-tRNA synthetase [Frigoriflavimonas asaccharolytica]